MERYNKETGEYINVPLVKKKATSFLNERKTLLNGIQRANNKRTIKAPGLFFTTDEDSKIINKKNTYILEWVPDYNRKVGTGSVLVFNYKQNINVEIGVLKRNGIRTKQLNLGTFMSLLAPELSVDTIINLVRFKPDYLKSELSAFNLPTDVKELDAKLGVNGLSNLIRVTYLTNNPIYKLTRFQDTFSLNKFLGMSLAEDITLNGLTYTQSTVLSHRLAFELEHSTLTHIKLLTEDNKELIVSIYHDGYNNLQLTLADDIATIDLEERDKAKYITTIRNPKEPNKALYPEMTTVEIFCHLINRILVFAEINYSDNMQELKNQKVSNLIVDVLKDKEKNLEELIENEAIERGNYLRGIQGVIPIDEDKIISDIVLQNDNSLVQVETRENPVSLVSAGNSITNTAKHLSTQALQVDTSMTGILDPMDQSEGSNIGKTLALSVTTKIINNELHTPLYVIKDKEVVDCQYYSVIAIENFIVAEYNVDLSQETVLAKTNKGVVFVPSKTVTHKRVSPFSSMSFSRATQTFSGNADGKRGQMAGKSGEQTRSIFGGERALVETGVESIIAKDKEIITRIEDIIDHNITIKYSNRSKEELMGYTYKLVSNSAYYVEMLVEIQAIEEPKVLLLYDVKKIIASSYAVSPYQLLPSPNNDNTYKPEDIIIAHGSYKKISNVTANPELDFHSDGKKEFFQDGIATGKNLRVMIGFYKNQNVDDACVISDRLVRDNSYTTTYMSKLKVEMKKGKGNDLIKYGFSQEGEKITADGLPKIGQIFYPGETICKLIPIGDKGYEKEIKATSKYYGILAEIKENIAKQEYTFHFYKEVPIDIGDKLSGKHGNKTIISWVVPHELMPYDIETGEHVDIILNPLSIPSRANTGQLTEMYESAKAKDEGVHKQIAPYSYQLEKHVEEYAQKRKLVMKQMVDPELGMCYPGENYVGYMYIYRLVHIAIDKQKSIGAPKNLSIDFSQPVATVSNKEKGQAIGAMENDILISKGCVSIIKEQEACATYDHKTYKQNMTNILRGRPDSDLEVGEGNSTDHLELVLLSRYSRPLASTEGVKITFADDNYLTSMYKILEETSQIDDIDDANQKDFVLIDLGKKRLNPVACEKLGVLGVLPTTNGFLPSDILNSMKHKEYYFVDSEYEEGMSDTDYRLWSVTTKYEQIENTKHNYYVGLDGLTRLIATARIDETLVKIKELLSENEGKASYYKIVEILGTAKMIKEVGDYKDFLSRYLPVIPYRFRPGNSLDKGVTYHDLTKKYKSIITSKADSTTDRIVYDLTKSLIIGDTNSDETSIASFLFDKENNGRVRNYQLRKRVPNSGRCTVAPSKDTNIDEVGLPIATAIDTYQPYVLRDLKEEFPHLFKSRLTFNSMRDYAKKFKTLFEVDYKYITEHLFGVNITEEEINDIFNTIKKTCDGRLVIYNRPPTLHDDNLRVGKIKVHRGTVLRIPTSVTPGYNADFDGDQMAVWVFFMPESQKEMESMLPRYTLLRTNDLKPSLEINQDSVLGLYLLTEPALETETIALTSFEQAKDYIFTHNINPRTKAILFIENKFIECTLGQMLVTDIIRRCGFVDKDYIFNKTISSGEFKGDVLSPKDIMLNLMDLRNPNTIDYIYELQELGYAYSHKANKSLGMDELVGISKFNLDKEKIYRMIAEDNELAKYGLNDVNFILKLNQTINEYKDSVDILDVLGDDNSFVVFAKSGAKGSSRALKSMYICIGVPASYGSTEAPIILTGLINGITQLNQETLMHKQREDAISTSKGTSDPGETLRTSMFAMNGYICSEPYGDVVEHIIPYKTVGQKILNKSKLIGNYYLGQEITEENVEQFSQSPLGSFHIEDVTGNKIEIEYQREPEDLFDRLVNSKFKKKDKANYKNSVANSDYLFKGKSPINYLGDEQAAIPQDYALTDSYLGKEDVPIKRPLGVKAAAAKNQPVSQMVISKRGLEAGTNIDGVGLLKDLILYGKMNQVSHNPKDSISSNSKISLAYLAPANGVCHVDISQFGKLVITLIAEDGVTYILNFTRQQTEELDLCVDIGISFIGLGQPVVKPKGVNNIKDVIHATMSFTWFKTVINNKAFHTALINPSNNLIQYIRYLLFDYVIDIYSTSGVQLELTHTTAFLQYTRLMRCIDSENILDIGEYTNVGYALDDINKCNSYYAFAIFNNLITISKMSGPLAGTIYQDSFKVMSLSAKGKPVKETAYISKMWIGNKINEDINIDRVNLNEKKTTEETLVNYVGKVEDNIPTSSDIKLSSGSRRRPKNVEVNEVEVKEVEVTNVGKTNLFGGK